MRHPVSLLAVIALVGGRRSPIVALIVAQAGRPGRQVQRGTGTGKVSETPEGTRVVSVKRTSAHDYDPLGDDEEHAEQASRTVDRDDGTAWTTEQYPAGIEGAGKAGVGVYIDAKPRVEAVAMQIETPEPGWRATIYAAPPGDAPKSIRRRLDEGRRRHRQQQGQALQARHGRPGLPLLPRLDHEARPGRRARRDLRDPAAAGRSRA